MDVHKNARLAFSCRVLLVERIQSGRPKVQAARELTTCEDGTRTVAPLRQRRVR
jgi:hypothetical protein